MPSALMVTMQQQEQCNWCWAAVAASLSSAMPLPPGMTAPMSQCEVASSLLCSTDANCCCDDGHVLYGCPESPCNVPMLIQNALNVIQHRGGASGTIPDQVTVIGEINSGHPIVGEIHWNDDQPQNHFVLIVDYTTNSSGEFVVKIADPADPTGTSPQCHSLDELQSGGYHGSGTWIESYFTA
jgi:hypothetical protein